MFQQIRSKDSHFCKQIGPKCINLEEDVDLLLPDKFRQILLSGC